MSSASRRIVWSERGRALPSSSTPPVKTTTPYYGCLVKPYR